MTTLGGVANADPLKGPIGVFIPQVPGVCPPDGYQGVPVVFANSEDVNTDFKLPYILVKRDDWSPANERWMPGAVQYRAPADGARLLRATGPQGQVKTGWDRMEQLAQAIPYDITYTISVSGRFRGAGQRNNANALFKHVLRTFPPYGWMWLTDSIGDMRSYEAFNEGISDLDNIVDVQDRTLGQAITLRVEGELDLKDPVSVQTVRTPLTRRIMPR